MDRLNVTYKDNYFKYNFRMPNDLSWFQITGCKEMNDENYETIHLYYNGKKVLFYSYKIKNNEKYITYYNEEERNIIKFRFINALVEKIGYNWFTIDLIEKVNVKVEYLKTKHKLNTLLSKKHNYTFEEYIDNTEYNNNYNVIIDGKEIGKISIKDKNIKLNLENNIELLKLIDKLNKELNHNKKLSKRLK